MFIDTDVRSSKPDDEDNSKDKLLIDTIGRLHDYSAHRSLKRMLAKIAPDDLAHILEALSKSHSAGVFCDIQEKEVAAEVLKLMRC